MATNSPAQTKDDAPVEPTPARKVPAVDPAMVQVNSWGHVTRELFVRLPADAVASDLAEPGLWTRVQHNRVKSLRKFDRLLIVAHDESYLWATFVAEAGPDFATLARPERYEMKARHNAYFATDEYRIEWNGSGFVVRRRKDDHLMPGEFPNEMLAIREVQRLYPKRVA